MLKYTVLACALALGTPVFAQQQQPTCDARQTIVDTMSRAGMSLEHLGLPADAPGMALEVWSNQETGLFTILATNAQGRSCVAVYGTDWSTFEPTPQGDPS